MPEQQLPLSDQRQAPAGAEQRSPAELLREVEELREALAARDSFIAIAAHELRNPMTPIRGQVEMLLRAVRGGYSAERLEHGLERLDWLVDQYMKRATTLLDISRATTGKFRLDAQPVELAPLVADTVQSLRPLATYAGSRITVEVPDTIRGIWDRLAIEQIVENLVSNAIKYGEGTPIHVSANVTGDRVAIAVRDQGPGIGKADQRRIFERFERAVDRSKQGAGFGVGLWIVRRLAQAMGGDIRVDSSPGLGSTFVVDLQLDTSEPE